MSKWIAIESDTTNDLAQIGFDHTYTSGGVSEYCRVRAIGTGIPVLYDCTGQPAGETVYFPIQLNDDGVYDIEDCGTGGNFNNCTSENAGQAAFGSAAGAASTEANYGCSLELLGVNYDAVDYGNDNWGLVGNNGSGWVAKSWTPIGPISLKTGAAGCQSDYDISISGDGEATWDTRNSS